MAHTPQKPASAAGANDGRDEAIGRLQQKIAALKQSSDALEAAVDRATAAELDSIDEQQADNEDAIDSCDGWISALEAGRPFVRPTAADSAALMQAIKRLGAATATSAAVNSLLTAANNLVKAYQIQLGGAGASAPAMAAAAPRPGRKVAVRVGKSAPTAFGRTFDARPDTVDFRDAMFVPTLVEVPAVKALDNYTALELPILDQGQEGACTGFGLAAVANYLGRQRQLTPLRAAGPLPKPLPPVDEASARMLFVLARRYDEWEGEGYDWSSARGAMKGWHKHGVCRWAIWNDAVTGDKDVLTEARTKDALDRPLGAYFRVNHKDLVAMHAAITEVGILYATCQVHDGWSAVAANGKIKFKPGVVGGHAFAIVGYDREGFWLQNSWGPKWGRNGFAHLSYADWLANGTDVWVARLGAPVDLGLLGAAEMRGGAPASYASYVYKDLRPHIVTVGNDGVLKATGQYGLTPDGLRGILRDDLVARVKGWKTKRVMLYAHGGLVPEDYAIQYAANQREKCLAAEVYPLSFIWRSDAWSTLGNILKEAVPGLAGGNLLDPAKDFLLDRLDDTLEPAARHLGGKALWDEMKENALLATTSLRGAARMVADELAALKAAGEIDEIHLAGHSAGAVFHAALASYLGTRGQIDNGPMVGQKGKGVDIASLSLWAPACTMALFYQAYLPLLEAGQLERFALYTLKDPVEQDDDCAHIYHKSLLYLVSNAFESKQRMLAGSGEPLLGLEKDVAAARTVANLFKAGTPHAWVHAPDPRASGAQHHGAFDNDPATLASTLSRITGSRAAAQKPAVFSVERAQRLRRSVAYALEARPRS